MDTSKVLLWGGVAVAAYFVYENFFAVPSSWTAIGGTSAQWSALTSAGQSQWNALPAASQTAANAITLIQTASSSTAAAAPAAAAPAAAVTVPAPAAAQGASGGNPLPPLFPPPPPQVAIPFPNYPGVTSLATLASLIQSMAANDSNLVSGAMPGDHWNYYANLITGKTIPPSWPSDPQNNIPISFSTYWTGAGPVIGGMTGLGSVMAGLGALVNAQRSRMGMGDYVPMGTPPQSFIPGGAMSPFFMDANTDGRSWN